MTLKTEIINALNQQAKTLTSSLINIQGDIKPHHLKKLNTMDSDIFEILLKMDILPYKPYLGYITGYYWQKRQLILIDTNSLASMSKSDLFNVQFAIIKAMHPVGKPLTRFRAEYQPYYTDTIEKIRIETIAWSYLIDNFLSDDVIDAYIMYREMKNHNGRKHSVLKVNTQFLQYHPHFFDNITSEKLEECRFRLDWLCEIVADYCKKDKTYKVPKVLMDHIEFHSTASLLSGKKQNSSFRADLKRIKKNSQ